MTRKTNSIKNVLFLLGFCLWGSSFAAAQTQTADELVSAYFQDLSSSTVAAGAVQKKVRPASRELTPVLMFAKANWSSLSPQTQATVKPWFSRPTTPGDTPPSGISFYQTGQNISTLSTPHFTFHYLDAANYPTDKNRATTTFIQDLATAAEVVWSQEITTMAYAAPPSDGVLGGSSKYDIYLIDVGAANIFGYVTSDATAYSGLWPYPNGIFSHMVIDNDFAQAQFGYTLPLDAGKVTLAHEFFHSIQYGYDSAEFPAFFEQLSTWMEDKVYPLIKDNLQYIGEPFVDSNGNGQHDLGEPFTDVNGNWIRDSGSQDYPELHLDSFGLSESQSEQYGRFLWIRYLSEKFSDVAILSILDATGTTPGNNTYAATDSTLINNHGSSLNLAFHEYGLWNMDVSRYINGADYPIAWGDYLFHNGAVNISSNASPSLVPFGGKQKHLSTIYELVNAPTGTYTFSSTGGNPALTAMVHTANGAYIDHPISTFINSSTSWVTPVGTQKVTFVISNTSATDDNMSWQLTDGYTDPLPKLSSPSKSSGLANGGSGCLTLFRSHADALWLLLLMLPFMRLRKRQV